MHIFSTLPTGVSTIMECIFNALHLVACSPSFHNQWEVALSTSWTPPHTLIEVTSPLVCLAIGSSLTSEFRGWTVLDTMWWLIVVVVGIGYLSHIQWCITSHLTRLVRIFRQCWLAIDVAALSVVLSLTALLFMDDHTCDLSRGPPMSSLVQEATCLLLAMQHT
jgi:hypothetical protein